MHRVCTALIGLVFLVFVCISLEARAFPIGNYIAELNGDEWVLTFSSDELKVFKNSQLVIISAYQVELETINFSNERGIYSCIGEVSSGTYRWILNHKGLIFEAIDDECPGRVSVLTTKPWRLKGGVGVRGPDQMPRQV